MNLAKKYQEPMKHDAARAAFGALAPKGDTLTPRDLWIRRRCDEIDRRLSVLARGYSDPNLCLFAGADTVKGGAGREASELAAEWVALYNEYHGTAPREKIHA